MQPFYDILSLIYVKTNACVENFKEANYNGTSYKKSSKWG